MAVTLTRPAAQRMLVAHLGLTRPIGSGRRGVRAVLERLRCIQLDPLDAIGTNADLVMMARVDGIARGDVWRHLFPGHAFEHFAKERCILPVRAFPFYRREGHGAQTHWWQHGERERRVAPRLIKAVLQEIRARGPIIAREVTDHGRVEPLDWSGWTGTANATSMAIEILWTLCDIVVAGRTDSGAKLYDVPERAFGTLAIPDEAFGPWALRERVHAAGLLSRSGGAMWSMLSQVRTSPIVDAMLARGELVEVQVEDSSRRYLTTPAFLKPPRVRFDDRVRILGPLDPLLWDRNLVRHIFDFDYVWEVYKPAAQRRWGWYVCPLLHRDTLIGRIDARIENDRLTVSKLWIERDDAPIDAVTAALERHAQMCGAKGVRMLRGARVKR